jgi:glutathione S-transferase
MYTSCSNSALRAAAPHLNFAFSTTISLTANNFFHTSCSNRSSAVLVVVSKTAPTITRSVAPLRAAASLGDSVSVSASRPPQQLLEAYFASSFRSSSSIPRSKFASLWSTRRGASSAAMAPHVTASSGLEAFGKAKSGSGSPSKERGDCPFSQRIYIELEEKKLPYEATYIEEGENKPEWFMEKNPKGLMPVLRDGETWIQDSDKIAEHLEEKYPHVSLKTPPQYKHIGLNVFQAFTSYLKVKNPDDKSKDELLKELAALDEHLRAHGPYIAGEKPTDSDYALIPKLHHMRIALGYYYDFQIPAKFTALHKYINLLESRPSFKNTNSPDEMIIEGWQKKFQLPGRMVQPTAAA